MTLDEIVEKYQRLQAKGLEDSPEGIALIGAFFDKAPQWLKSKAMLEAGKAGLFPKPYGHDDNGRAYYRLDDIAEHLGISVEEAEETVKKLSKNRPERSVIEVTPDTPIHRHH